MSTNPMSMIPFPRNILGPPRGMPDRQSEPCRDALAGVGTCLLIIDMINTFAFPDSEKLFPAIVESAERIARLKQRAATSGMSTIYVNDNFGKWRHDFGRLVEHCLTEPCKGKPVAGLLHPTEDDYFVLKPKHSGFYATPLELLLKFLGARRLIVTGVAGDNCILYTAADAYMREFTLCTPADCIVSIDAHANQGALEHMRTNLKADLRDSDEVDLSAFHNPDYS